MVLLSIKRNCAGRQTWRVTHTFILMWVASLKGSTDAFDFAKIEDYTVQKIVRFPSVNPMRSLSRFFFCNFLINYKECQIVN